MSRTLTLTSPWTQGDDVRFTQELLAGKHGPYSDFMRMFGAPVDGTWREGSAEAAKRAKFMLGFPLAEVDGRAGDELRGRLQQAPVDLPKEYQARRRARLHPRIEPIGIRALRTAVKQIG